MFLLDPRWVFFFGGSSCGFFLLERIRCQFETTFFLGGHCTILFFLCLGSSNKKRCLGPSWVASIGNWCFCLFLRGEKHKEVVFWKLE